ncbi:MAG: hypothetical protein JW874_11025 [Spirochaetales bacterium]|nr:hypothetical protein [Spirochaetales bacterium]
MSAKIRLLPVLLMLSLFFSCSGTPTDGKTVQTQKATTGQDNQTAPSVESPVQKVVKADSAVLKTPIIPVQSETRINWDGIIDWSSGTMPCFVWSGCKAVLRFSGTQLFVCFGTGSNGQIWFNLIIDGEPCLFRAVPGNSYTLNLPLENGTHELVLFKRSEAETGYICLEGFAFPDGELLDPPSRPERTLEFLGDSITTGSCNEDSGPDQWADRSTHNFYLSWAAITSRALGTGLRAAVQSGMVISTGYYQYQGWQLWDRANAKPDGPVGPVPVPAPDAYIINLGENDYSYPKANGLKFPDDFTEKYIDLVRKIRARYPETLIVCTMGGMTSGRYSAPLNNAWKAAMDILSGSDPKIVSFKFRTVSSGHPRVTTHQRLADEIVPFLKEQLGW